MRQPVKLNTWRHSVSCFQIVPMPECRIRSPFGFILKATAFPTLPTESHSYIFLGSEDPRSFGVEKEMADWAPVVIGVVLFVLLQPGLLFALPGNSKRVEFGSLNTNGKAIFIHTLIFFALYAVLIVAVHVHIYAG